MGSMRLHTCYLAVSFGTHLCWGFLSLHLGRPHHVHFFLLLEGDPVQDMATAAHEKARDDRSDASLRSTMS